MTAGWRSEARERERIADECDLPASSEDLVRALDALDAVLALHQREGEGEYAVCCHCVEEMDLGYPDGVQPVPATWPCPTVRAIEGTDAV